MPTRTKCRRFGSEASQDAFAILTPERLDAGVYQSPDIHLVTTKSVANDTPNNTGEFFWSPSRESLGLVRIDGECATYRFDPESDQIQRLAVRPNGIAPFYNALLKDVSFDGKHLLLCSGSEARLVNMMTGKTHNLPLPDGSQIILSKFSADGGGVWIGCVNKKVPSAYFMICSIDTLSAEKIDIPPLSAMVLYGSSTAYFDSSRRLAVLGHGDGGIQAWDLKTNKEVVIGNSGSPVAFLEATKDRSSLIAIHTDGDLDCLLLNDLRHSTQQGIINFKGVSPLWWSRMNSAPGSMRLGAYMGAEFSGYLIECD